MNSNGPHKMRFKFEKYLAAFKILIVDNHDLVREGLVSLFQDQPDFLVVGEAQNGQEAIVQSKALRPDAIVMDIEMPQINGIEATRRILKERPEVVVIGLSMYNQKDYRQKIIDAGALAHVDKLKGPDSLLGTVRRVLSQAFLK